MSGEDEVTIGRAVQVTKLPRFSIERVGKPIGLSGHTYVGNMSTTPLVLDGTESTSKTMQHQR
jgi:hypothetical protein